MEKKKEFQISSSVNEGILEIVITGEVTKNDLKNVDEEMVTLLKTAETRFMLVDLRAMKRCFGTFETYSHVHNTPPEIRRVDAAIVDLEENADHQSFHETAARNAGILLKWFTDIDAARAWLKSKQG
jgi:hypothetical protein